MGFAVEDVMTSTSSAPIVIEETSTTALLKEAVDEAKELVRIEVALARAEIKTELARAKRAAIAMAVALVCAIVVLCVLSVALVLALGGTPLVALAIAGVFLAFAACAAAVGYGMLPKKPLEQTRDRLGTDVNQLREHIA